MLEYDFTAKFIDEVVHRFLIGAQISEIADDTYNPVEDIEELLRQRMSETAREIDALKKAQNNDAAPAADVTQVVRCRDCVCMGKRPPLPEGYREDCGWCMLHGRVVLPEDYCSNGERMNDDA